MAMYIAMGWRNIWRNPRRTMVILIAVVVGVWSMILLGALMRGIGDGMVRNGIAALTGHIQVHHRGYRSDPAVENSMKDPRELASVLGRLLPKESFWTERVRVNAIASNARHSSGITMVGIEPEREAKVSFIKRAVTRGRYLRSKDPYGIIVGKALMEEFETRPGHKLVLMSQDTRGEISSRAFEIVGVFRAEMAATEKQFVFITLSSAQEMLNLKKGISEVSILLSSNREVGGIATDLQAALPSKEYEVSTWQELLPVVTAVLKLYDGFIFLWFLVVFVAMGFGIVNTTLMAIFERIREFGLLKALGMKPGGIVREVLTESFFLLVLGMAIGNSLGFLSIFALSRKGIDLSSLAAGLEYAGMARVIYPIVQNRDILMANLVVLILGLAVSLYPAVKAARFTPVEALVHT